MPNAGRGPAVEGEGEDLERLRLAPGAARAVAPAAYRHKVHCCHVAAALVAAVLAVGAATVAVYAAFLALRVRATGRATDGLPSQAEDWGTSSSDLERSSAGVAAPVASTTPAPTSTAPPSTTLTASAAALEQTRYPWDLAVRRFYKVPVPQQRDSVHETLWASGAEHRCSEPCVAHCLVGQWRRGMNERPDWPEVTRAQFATFSPASVVFALWSISGLLPGDGWTRSSVERTTLDVIQKPLTELMPNRALIIEERCTTANCYYQTSRMQCDRSNITKFKDYFPPDRYWKLYGQCDIQVDRLRQCLTLVREYEQEHKMTFDWITRDRVDHHWHPEVPVTNLNRTLTYMTPWCEGGGARACFGGFDWWYAMPRAHADIIAGFRDGITCKHIDREDILERDPVMGGPSKCQTGLGCEGWLASWLLDQRVPFVGLGCRGATR